MKDIMERLSQSLGQINRCLDELEDWRYSEIYLDEVRQDTIYAVDDMLDELNRLKRRMLDELEEHKDEGES